MSFECRPPSEDFIESERENERMLSLVVVLVPNFLGLFLDLLSQLSWITYLFMLSA